ncbi:MAG TPA: flagellar basal body rod protein FlgB [Solirubrobacteraceae bacterium]|nr:flagellar basal body rod protein FlgB [Solirubrobacteraceae bacterium]
MDVFDTTQIALGRAMEGAAQRQTVLAGNLANANTAGYVRRDVDFTSTLRDALKADDPDKALEDATFSETTDPGAVQGDGNGVDLDTESSALAQNGLLYQSLASVLRTRNAILEDAIGGSH